MVETSLKTHTQNERCHSWEFDLQNLFNIKVALPSDAFPVIPKSLEL